MLRCGDENQVDDQQHQWHQMQTVEKLETVNSFKYLGSMVSDEGSRPKSLCRVAQTTAAMAKTECLSVFGMVETSHSAGRSD